LTGYRRDGRLMRKQLYSAVHDESQ